MLLKIQKNFASFGFVLAVSFLVAGCHQSSSKTEEVQKTTSSNKSLSQQVEITKEPLTYDPKNPPTRLNSQSLAIPSDEANTEARAWYHIDFINRFCFYGGDSCFDYFCSVNTTRCEAAPKPSSRIQSESTALQRNFKVDFKRYERKRTAPLDRKVCNHLETEFTGDEAKDLSHFFDTVPEDHFDLHSFREALTPLKNHQPKWGNLTNNQYWKANFGVSSTAGKLRRINRSDDLTMDIIYLGCYVTESLNLEQFKEKMPQTRFEQAGIRLEALNHFAWLNDGEYVVMHGTLGPTVARRDAFKTGEFLHPISRFSFPGADGSIIALYHEDGLDSLTLISVKDFSKYDHSKAVEIAVSQLDLVETIPFRNIIRRQCSIRISWLDHAYYEKIRQEVSATTQKLKDEGTNSTK